MYGIFTYICPKNHPNVGKYNIHGPYGIVNMSNPARFLWQGFDRLKRPVVAMKSPSKRWSNPLWQVDGRWEKRDSWLVTGL